LDALHGPTEYACLIEPHGVIDHGVICPALWMIVTRRRFPTGAGAAANKRFARSAILAVSVALRAPRSSSVVEFCLPACRSPRRRPARARRTIHDGPVRA